MKVFQFSRIASPITWLAFLLTTVLLALIGVRGQPMGVIGGSFSGPTGGAAGVWESFEHGWPWLFLDRSVDELETGRWALWKGESDFRLRNLLGDIGVWLLIVAFVFVGMEYWLRRKKGRERWQWRLSTMFLATFVLSCVLSWWCCHRHQHLKEIAVFDAFSHDVVLGARAYRGPLWLERLCDHPRPTVFERVTGFELVPGVNDERLLEMAPRLSTLKYCESVWTLDCNITEHALGFLVDLREIEFLFLDRTNVGDELTAILLDLPNLRILRLDETKVTDAAIKDLGKMKNLEVLWVGGTAMTDEGVDRLKAALPDTLVTQ